MKLVVLADDFTGANDVALQIKKYGVDVVSLIDENLINCFEVSVVSSESRNIEASLAYERVEEIFLKMLEMGFEKFYKKIDSNLRGNLNEEIEAILKHIGKDERVIVVPSFPKTGRTVKHGKHYVNGVPLHMSEFSRDPIHPVRTNKLSELFKNGENVFLKDVRGDLKRRLIGVESRVVIIDAETEDDLELISKALVDLGMDRYVVGSAGIMEYLMKDWGYKRERVLVVSGSCNDKNLEQIEYFLDSRGDKVNFIELDLENRTKNSFENLENDEDIFVSSIRDKSDMYRIIEKGYDTDEISSYVGCFAAGIVRRYGLKKIFVSGGETCLKVLKNLGLNGLRVKKEIEPGIALCISLDEKYEIVTKPGGGGSLEIFQKCISRF